MSLLIKPENETEERILSDDKILKGYEFGKVRSGHPEGNTGVHVTNILSFIDKQNWTNYREKLRTITLIHDSFKYLQFVGGLNHAVYAAQYYAQLVSGEDICKMNIAEFKYKSREPIPVISNPEQEEVKKVLLHHDSGWRFYKRIQRNREFDENSFVRLFGNLDLEMMIRFNYADGCQRDNKSVIWFEDELIRCGLRNHSEKINDHLVR